MFITPHQWGDVEVSGDLVKIEGKQCAPSKSKLSPVISKQPVQWTKIKHRVQCPRFPVFTTV